MITIQDNSSEVIAALQQLQRKIGDLTPVMENIGAILQNAIRENMGRGQTPWGEAFEPLKLRSGVPLNDTRQHLYNRITHRATADRVEVGLFDSSVGWVAALSQPNILLEYGIFWDFSKPRMWFPSPTFFVGLSTPTQPTVILFVTNIVGELHDLPSPICRHNALADIPVDTAVWPIRRSRHIPMLDRIVMDVIDMMSKIAIVSYAMFPKTRLPYCLLIFIYSSCGNRSPLFGFHLFCQCAFDIAPTNGIIRVSPGGNVQMA